LTRVVNKKAREDRLLEEGLDFPFYIPSTKETLDQETYLCALLLAIKQLELTQRVITHEMRMIREVRPAR
jgi:hypothetical protein